jgi:hypothetical protein
MACFTAPETAAIVLTVVRKKIDPRLHINWLLALLWGGVAWLIPEHIYHGEVVLYPPFFTKGLPAMLPEIIRVGVPMTIVAVAVWAIILTTVATAKNRTFQPRLAHLAIIGAIIMVAVDKLLA